MPLGCQGACAQTPTCNNAQFQSASSPNSFLHWSGCGFSNAGFGTPPNPAQPTYPTDTGDAIVCALDCPRTSVAWDDGNPTNPYATSTDCHSTSLVRISPD